MILRSPTKAEKITENIFDCFILIAIFVYRISASFIMLILALGFAQQHDGEPHQWFLHLTALMLFFCPWGSPVRRRIKERVEEYIDRGRDRKMREEGILFQFESTFRIEQSHIITQFILLLVDVYINGTLGIIYGWKTPLIMIYNFFWLIRDTGRLIIS